ncbi:unnamed protein product [Darwinula stevensoni]|uniref:Chlorophyllase n=1 Tax=Darwinula stevensoni TaxID=69355 RepID=A0A7R9A999_9CRUS|nr:unnamed protein product [Darwinula stevensoni]CAG0897200.1 unnamed protein product [Darwinula stevensoni]
MPLTSIASAASSNARLHTAAGFLVRLDLLHERPPPRASSSSGVLLLRRPPPPRILGISALMEIPAAWMWLAVLAFAPGTSAFQDPYEPDPANPVWVFKAFNFLTILTGLKYNLDLYVPRTESPLPVLYFLPGFQATVPSTLYSTVLKHVASHGFLVVGVWNPLGIIDSDYRAKELEGVVGWVERNLENWLRKDLPLQVSLDHARSTLACQSAGCHIAVSFLSNQGCANFKSLVMISPVDGKDPFGIIQQFIITPNEKVPFSIPSLTLAAGLDPLQTIPFFPACAPENLSNKRFFDAMRDVPRWYISATDYGHADLLDPIYVAGNQLLKVCSTNPLTDKATYRRYIAGQIIAFLRSFESLESCEQALPRLRSPTLVRVETVSSGLDCGTSTPTIVGADKCAGGVAR